MAPSCGVQLENQQKLALADGYCFRVGSGKISIWYDRWLGEELICDLVLFVYIEDTQLSIYDIIYFL